MTADLSSSGMFIPSRTTSTILCPTCGERIAPNPTNTCSRCLLSRSDLTSSLPTRLSLVFCPDCSSYLDPPRTWFRADLESKQLLSFCLRRLTKPLSSHSLRLSHAEFVWTEPHSKRIKVKIRVQGEVSNAVLEQSHVVEFTVNDHLCDSCSKANANPDQWVAKVQLRQHVPHRRTFFYLEQLILKHKAAEKAVRIQETDQGIDFMFANRSHGVKFLEFVTCVVPVQSRSDKSLVSHDSKNSTYNYHYTFSVQICPICREDLICLPPALSHSLGNLGPIVICTKITNNIALMDPLTLRVAYLDADKYWRTPFKAFMTSRQLVQYVVLDVEVESPEVDVNGTKYCLAQVQVARVSDFGKNDNIFMVKTHLGHLLNPGDYALGYDLYGANPNDEEIDKYKGLVIPEAILIKKSFEEKRKKGVPRAWKLKRLNMEVDTNARGKIDPEKRNDEYEKFLRDLAANPDERFNISLYRNKDYQSSEMASTVDGDDSLDECLADLRLSDGEDSNADSMME